MALNKAQRNGLRNTVIRCRRLLEEATSGTLEGRFGIQRSGEVEDLSQMGHLSESELQYREQVASHLLHLQAMGFTAKDAVARLVREASYTHLNRLCAYKMLETQGALRRVVGRGLGSNEVVGRGLKSNGFMFYLADHPDDQKLWSSGQQDLAYRHFLEWLGDALSEEIGVLFSSTDPANRLFPPHRMLEDVLELLNAEEIEAVWDEEETMGWVYQYYTPKELRDQARKESQSPRNSYELAFRNQFYTPDYVVRFLADNTLGRTWYEMRQGDYPAHRAMRISGAPARRGLSRGRFLSGDSGCSGMASGRGRARSRRCASGSYCERLRSGAGVRRGRKRVG